MRAKINLSGFFSEMNKKKSEIDKLVKHEMPKHAGTIGVEHVKQNFRKGGFVNNGLTKWKKSNREMHGGKGAKNNHRTLLSGRNHLYSSTKSIPNDAKVTIKNDAPYAGVHNWGLEGLVVVNPFTRKRNGKVQHVKGHTRNMNIPQRQFLGESKEMNEEIRTKFVVELEKIFKQ